MLELSRRFHTYSANNVFLILAQQPDATSRRLSHLVEPRPPRHAWRAGIDLRVGERLVQ